MAVVVESMRTCVPASMPRSLASCNSTASSRSQVLASIMLMALCSDDFFGTRHGSTRAKRCVLRESRSANSNSRYEKSISRAITAQRRIVSQVSPIRPHVAEPPTQRPTISSSSGC